MRTVEHDIDAAVESITLMRTVEHLTLMRIVEHPQLGNVNVSVIVSFIDPRTRLRLMA